MLTGNRLHVTFVDRPLFCLASLGWLAPHLDASRVLSANGIEKRPANGRRDKSPTALPALIPGSRASVFEKAVSITTEEKALVNPQQTCPWLGGILIEYDMTLVAVFRTRPNSARDYDQIRWQSVDKRNIPPLITAKLWTRPG